MSTAMTKDKPIRIVIVGGSYAGHMAFSSICKNHADVEMDITMVSMSKNAYYNVISPRLLAEPEKFDQVTFSVEDFVRKYSGGKARFVQGKVTKADFTSNSVSVETSHNPQEAEKIEYDLLVIATGAKSNFAGFKVNSSADEAKAAIEKTVSQLQTAKSVAVIGGGPTGVETCGEIASKYKSISVTLYTGSVGPLPTFPSLTRGATDKLSKLGVKVINGVKSVERKSTASGTQVVLDNGETKTFDVVIEATRETPFSDFVPASAKDEVGWVLTDNHLVVKGTENVVALGDIVSGSPKTIVDLKRGQIGVFSDTVKYLLGSSSTLGKEYCPVTNLILIPVSRTGGEGLIYGWHAPNWAVWFLKSRTFMIERAGEAFE
ncbi:putative apoptosis-inducing factor [Clavispora lusitaniae]|uniref:Apoptosis-inducing factor n=1 Tax=Clavispora lusitaniae TaxID=36911 RepID=A0ACD0WHK5_CLALS|nr:putative apoptosis-inducing factor [Clavispora lusitaniae]QFZ32453.1 putative apoptosis-inducing factor [Clavispora lusitaniae]QFZ38122.1 putative apoptosis-inducing factor [Clavispora lusitaniae]QFZ43805.1 putative apoptosis-inducing factor [Clavispora lusitaniae]QFZ49482.1 putative apoptosis-inducing factor [Clavispora lusitaniae]